VREKEVQFFIRALIYFNSLDLVPCVVKIMRLTEPEIFKWTKESKGGTQTAETVHSVAASVDQLLAPLNSRELKV